MPRKRTNTSPLYWKGGRAYADFRGPEYAPWGGKQVALKAEGERQATTDPEVANILLAEHLKRFRELRKKYPRGIGVQAGDDPLNLIAPFAGYHLSKLRVAKKRRNGRPLTAKTVAAHEHALVHAARFLQRRKDRQRPKGVTALAEITPADVSAWLADLEKNAPPRSGSGGRRISRPSTIGKYLAALSRMLRRAWREERIPFNPVDKLAEEDRPGTEPSPTHHLEVAEAALALEAARRSVAHGGRAPYENYVRMAAYLLTGGSGNDVAGLEKADIDWDGERVIFRQNASRRGTMKDRPERSVPLFPQLGEILREYIAGPHCPAGPALFRGGDMDRWLDTVGLSIGFKPKHLRTRVFRVTYATARAQTLDGGHPISIWTLRDELGHSSLAMLQRVYARVGRVRQRSEHVSYLWSDHSAVMGHRLRATGPALTDNARVALATLAAHDGLTMYQWSEASGLGPGNTYYLRDVLQRRGLVVADGGGRAARYHLTATGTAALQQGDGLAAAAGG